MSYLQLAGRRLPPLWLCEAHDLSTNELKSEFLCSWHTGTPLETLVHWVNVSGDSRVVHTVCSHLKKSHSIRTDPRRIMHTPNELRSLWTGLFWHHLFFFCVLLRNNRAIQTHGYFHMQTGMQLKLEEETNVQAMLSTLQCYRRRLGSDKPKYIFIIYFQSTLASLETIQIFVWHTLLFTSIIFHPHHASLKCGVKVVNHQKAKWSVANDQKSQPHGRVTRCGNISIVCMNQDIAQPFEPLTPPWIKGIVR
jgi:hypothetical protein